MNGFSESREESKSYEFLTIFMVCLIKVKIFNKTKNMHITIFKAVTAEKTLF